MSASPRPVCYWCVSPIQDSEWDEFDLEALEVGKHGTVQLHTDCLYALLEYVRQKFNYTLLPWSATIIAATKRLTDGTETWR